jgi:hypothetical protein
MSAASVTPASTASQEERRRGTPAAYSTKPPTMGTINASPTATSVRSKPAVPGLSSN